MGYQVTALKKLSKKKKPVGKGKGHSDLPVSVEPEAFDDIPMNPSAGCTALSEITAGQVRNAPDTPMLHIVPRNLGRLTLPRFHVHQIAGKLKMNGGRDEQERIGSKPAVYG